LLTAKNELLTRVGQGTPMGNLLRRYWMLSAAPAIRCDCNQADPPDGRTSMLLGT
jgi:hypothetical protein